MSDIDIKTQIFENCLVLLGQGHSPQDILKKYPEHAAELEPLLKTAQQTRNYAATIQVPSAARNRSRAKFLQAAALARGSLANAATQSGFSVPPRRNFRTLRFAVAAFVVIILLLSAGSLGAVSVSAGALPGDALYPVKRVAEKTRLLLAPGASQKLELEKSFNEERISELHTLVTRSKTAVMVDFAGPVEAMSATWQVNQVTVIVNGQTKIDGEIALGDYVSVVGQLLSDGSVLASQIHTNKVSFDGVVHDIAGNTWKVDDLELTISAQTQMTRLPSIGDKVKIDAIMLGDGSLLAKNVMILVENQPPATNLQAQETEEPTHTQVIPTQTPGFEPTDTEEPTKQPKPTIKPSSEPTDEEHPTEEVKPSKTPEPTQTEESHGSREKHETEKPKTTLTPTPTQTATPTITGTRRPRWMANPTKTPTPTEKSSDDHD